MPKKSAEPKKSQISFSDEFYSDLEEEGCLFGVLVRSPYEKGKIVSINASLPKDYYFIGNDDLPAKHHIHTTGEKTPLFCEKKIAFKGQAVGILCGPDLKEAKRLSEEVEISIENENTLENIIAKENIMAANHGEMPEPSENILAKRVVETGNVGEKFKDAAVCVDGDYSSIVGKQFFGDTNGAFVSYKAGKLKVLTPTLWISHLKENLLDVTGLSEEKVFISRTKTCATDTSSLYLNTEIACQAAVASIILKKSVKLVLSRKEQELYVGNSTPIFISHKAALDEEGVITALDTKITINCGAYNPMAEEIVDRLTITAAGIYDIQNLRIVTVAKANPSVPANFDVSRLDSQTFFAIENFMNKVSFLTGIPAVDLRLSNIRLSPAQKTSMPFLFQPGKIYECLDAVSRMSDFSRKHMVYRVSELNRKNEMLQSYSPFNPPLRGIGFACAFEGSVFFGSHFGSGNIFVTVTMTKEDAITIYSLPVSSSIKSIWLDLVEKILEIPRENVKITENLEHLSSMEFPILISRNIGVMTSLLEKCLEAAKNKKGKASFPFTVKKTLNSPLKKMWSKTDFRGTPYHFQSFGCAVVELEFNPEIFREEIRKISICIDGGKIVSKKSAIQTIKIEVQKCLKEFVKDENLICPQIDIKLIESEKEPKQIGTLVSSILPAAYTSALSQSLSLTVSSLPLETESLYELLQREKKRRVGSDGEFFDVLADFLEEGEQ